MNDYLALACELAVAFAGFSAIVSALDAGTEADVRWLHGIRLRQMLELSLLTIAGGLLPQVLAGLGIEAAASWRVSAAVLAAASLAVMKIQIGYGLAARWRKAPGYSIRYARFLQALGVLVILTFVLAAIGVRPSEGLYIVGVTFLLTLAGMQFLRTTVSILGSSPRDKIPE